MTTSEWLTQGLSQAEMDDASMWVGVMTYQEYVKRRIEEQEAEQEK